MEMYNTNHNALELKTLVIKYRKDSYIDIHAVLHICFDCGTQTQTIRVSGNIQ